MTGDAAARAGMDFGWAASRETARRFERFEELLEKWNPYANLVSRRSLVHCRERHFRDSAQLFRHAPGECRKWLDLGAGGGFPGIVLACMAREARPEMEFILADSNERKCRFLNLAARELGLNARAVGARAEALEPQRADAVSARAMAPLRTLLGYAKRHLAPGGLCVFPKSAGYAREVEEARKLWAFDLEAVPSETEESSAILLIGSIRHA